MSMAFWKTKEFWFATYLVFLEIAILILFFVGCSEKITNPEVPEIIFDTVYKLDTNDNMIEEYTPILEYGKRYEIKISGTLVEIDTNLCNYVRTIVNVKKSDYLYRYYYKRDTLEFTEPWRFQVAGLYSSLGIIRYENTDLTYFQWYPGNYNPEHIYTTTITGDGKKLNMRVFLSQGIDCWKIYEKFDFRIIITKI